MNQVLAVTIPIFLLIGVGYFAVRARLVEQAGLKTMAAFVLNFALPALIVKALAARKLSEVADASYFLVYGGASLLVFAAVYAIARWGLSRGQSQAAIQALGGRRWQALHRSVYAIALLSVIHFWWLVKRDIREPLIYAVLLAALLAIRFISRLKAARSGL
jgi:predicted permease